MYSKNCVSKYIAFISSKAIQDTSQYCYFPVLVQFCHNILVFYWACRFILEVALIVVLWRSCNTFVDKFSFPRLIKEINFFTDRPMKMWHVAKTEPHSFFSLHPHVSDQPQPPLPSYQTRPPPPAMDSVRWSTTQESLQALLFNMQFPWFFFPIRLTISDSFKKPQILFLYINLIKPIVVRPLSCN